MILSKKSLRLLADHIYRFLSSRPNRGFTLIELLVVVAIIGILITLISAGFRQAQRNARDQRRAQDLTQVKIALEQYFELNLEYPENGTGADLGEIKCPGVPAIDWGLRWACSGQTYMRALPTDPTATPQYCYSASGGPPPTAFSLYANMENSSNANITSTIPAGCPGTDAYNYQLESEK